jgi:hypothetical protein
MTSAATSPGACVILESDTPDTEGPLTLRQQTLAMSSKDRKLSAGLFRNPCHHFVHSRKKAFEQGDVFDLLAPWRLGPRQGLLMLRRKKRTQLAKNIIAESECVIEFGEHTPYSLGSTAG